MNPHTFRNLHTPQADSGIDWKRLVAFILIVALLPLVLFVAAGRFNWWQAWVFSVVILLSNYGSRYLLFRKDRALLTERWRFTGAENIQNWDKLIAPVIAILGPLVVLIVAGLDKRNGWSPDMSPIWSIIGIFMMVLGAGVGVWAMLVNPFFSSVVRIQQDRGQTVITSGPYQIVRHPAYSGSVLLWLGVPILLETVSAFIPVGMQIVLLIVRTALEDRTLQAELPGYKDYTQQTRYRLLPGLW